MNEWAVRMPGVLWLALAIALTAWLAQRWYAARAAGVVAVLLASTTIIFTLGSFTMTDQALLAALVGAMVGFAVYFETSNPWWARAAFFALGLSLLSKGPVGLLFPGVSLAAFVVLSGSWRKALQIPWITGLGIMLAVAAPWYIAMEQQQPGFLKYFLIDENFNRMFAKDLVLRHGTDNASFRGVALVCFCAVTMPWLLFLPGLIKRAGWRSLLPVRHSQNTAQAPFDRELYLVCWFAAPVLPLAIGEQILPHYLLSLAPGFVIWLVAVNERIGAWRENTLVATGAVTSIAYTVIIGALGPLFLDTHRSTRPIIEAFIERVGNQPEVLVFGGRVPESRYFYLLSDVSRNIRIASLPLEQIRAHRSPRWVVTRPRDLKQSGLAGYNEVLTLDKWVLLERI